MAKYFKIFSLSLPLLLLAVACSQTPAGNDSAQTINVTQIVAGGEIQQLHIINSDHKSALDLLRGSYQLQTKNFGAGLGEFVEEINGVKPAQDEFWAFYVNSQSSNVGASSYLPKDGDSLEWRLEKITN